MELLDEKISYYQRQKSASSLEEIQMEDFQEAAEHLGDTFWQRNDDRDECFELYCDKDDEELVKMLSDDRFGQNTIARYLTEHGRKRWPDGRTRDWRRNITCRLVHEHETQSPQDPGEFEQMQQLQEKVLHKAGTGWQAPSRFEARLEADGQRWQETEASDASSMTGLVEWEASMTGSNRMPGDNSGGHMEHPTPLCEQESDAMNLD